MEFLGSLGMLLGGLGLLLLSFGVLWFTSLWAKSKGLEEEKKK